MPKATPGIAYQLNISHKPSQRISLLPQMQRALQLLQLPIAELASLIEVEMTQNPLLEWEEALSSEGAGDEEFEYNLGQEEQELDFSDTDFSLLQQLEEEFSDHRDQSGTSSMTRGKEMSDQHQQFIENCLVDRPSLFEAIMSQVQEWLQTPQECAIAETIVGSLNLHGYLQTPLEEIASWHHVPVEQVETILHYVQRSEPIGIGARSLQELLLLQLERKEGGRQSLAYRLVDNHFEQLLQNKLPQIRKELRCSMAELYRAIHQEIAHLQLHPGYLYSKDSTQIPLADLFVFEEEGELHATINKEEIPLLRMNKSYLRLLNDQESCRKTKDFLKQKIGSAKWLLHNLHQRNQTLLTLMRLLLDRQRTFFLGEGGLVPLTMQEIASAMNVHESTVARAVMHKHVATPQGLFPLRYFFTHSLPTTSGDLVAPERVKALLKRLIDQEDKAHPHSDERLVALLKAQQLLCARRTIAKYRQEMAIGNQRQRRRF